MTRLCEGAVATAVIVWKKELLEIATPLACGSRFAMTRERVLEKASVDGRGTSPVIPACGRQAGRVERDPGSRTQ